MPHLQFATYADMPSPLTVSASSEAVGFPAANCRVIQKPFRTWHSNAAGAQWLRYDYAAPISLAGVFTNIITSGTLEIRTRATLVASEVSQFTLNPVLTDQRVQRSKYLWTPVSPVSVQSVILYPTVQTDVTIPGYELGAIVPITAWRDFADIIESPLRWSRLQSISSTGMLGGGIQQNSEGRAYVRVTLSNSHWKYTAMADFLAKLNANPGQPILIYEDRFANGDRSQAYLMQRITNGEDQIEESVTTFTSQMVFEELV